MEQNLYPHENCMLIIDPDRATRQALKQIFAGKFSIREADTGPEGLAFLEGRDRAPAVIMLAMELPGMGGMALLDILCKRGLPDRIPVFLITAVDALEAARDAYALGVMGVITKPVVPFVVERRVQVVAELFRAREALKDQVRRQEQTIHKNVQTIDALHRSTLEAMASAIEFRDVELGEHTDRIYSITRMLLQETGMGAGFTPQEIENMAIGSIMHDVGKIAISDVILNKPGKLTPDEYEIMQQHTVKGGQLMERLSRKQDHPSYRYAQDIARHHHERWDGSGYPDGLKGEEITPWVQVTSIADVYDALVSARAYKRSFSPDEAVTMIRAGQCGAFNPKLVACFEQIEPRLRALYRQDQTHRAPGVEDPLLAEDWRGLRKDAMDTILLTAAVRQFYDMIIGADLTEDRFHVLSSDHGQPRYIGKNGSFDALIREGARAIPPSHRQQFLDTLSRESLLRAFGAGKKNVTIEHPQYADDGALMHVSTNVLLTEDPRSGSVRIITLIRHGDQPEAEG